MCGTRVFFVFRKFFKMLECKSEVPYVITLERELSQMPLKMRFLDVKQVREGELQYFYAVIANFRHARRLVEEGVRQNPAFVQNGENVAKTGQIGDIVSSYIFGNFKNFRSNGRRFKNRREKLGRRKGRRRPSRKTRKPLRPRRFGG